MKIINFLKLCILFLCGSILTMGCNLPLSGKGTESPDAVYTQVANTVQVQLTKEGPHPSGTITPTLPTLVNNPTAPAPNLPTQPPTDPSLTQAIPTATIETADKATWIAQTPSDGTEIPIGSKFKVTWTIQNTGKTTWKTNYQLRFYAGTSMDSPASTPFPSQVKPQDQIDLSLNLSAPSKPGDYQGIWVLTNDQGVNFYPVYLRIKVVNTPTLTPTVTVNLTATSIYCKDNPGTCPTSTP